LLARSFHRVLHLREGQLVGPEHMSLKSHASQRFPASAV
jgi:hypothetical protein